MEEGMSCACALSCAYLSCASSDDYGVYSVMEIRLHNHRKYIYREVTGITINYKPSPVGQQATNSLSFSVCGQVHTLKQVTSRRDKTYRAIVWIPGRILIAAN